MYEMQEETKFEMGLSSSRQARQPINTLINKHTDKLCKSTLWSLVMNGIN